MNVDKICEEIIWYSEKINGRYLIPIVLDYDFCLTCESSWMNGTFKENPHAFFTLKKWMKKYNVGFILETMRGKKHIQPAIDFIKSKGIELYGIGRNPLQGDGEDLSCKVWGVFGIDDRNVGIPLIKPKDSRPYVDWYKVDEIMSPVLEQICKRIEEVEERVLEAKRLAREENKFIEIDYSY